MLSLACSQLSHRKLGRWKATCITHTYTNSAEQKNRVERGKRGRREKERAKNAEVTFGAENKREERVRKR